MSGRAMFYGLGHGAFYIPCTKDYARVQGRLPHPELLREFGDCEFLAAKLDKDIPPRVSTLLFLGGPAAVARFVVAIVIDAVKGMAGSGTRPHVGEEVWKAPISKPSVRDFDTTHLVVFDEFLVPAIATGKHVRPGIVFGQARQAVRPISGIGEFDTVATAGCGRAVSEIAMEHVFNDSATAPTIPVFWTFRTPKNNPSSKDVASQIHFGIHAPMITENKRAVNTEVRSGVGE